MKKICVVTGTRAEYGLLANVMQEIKQHPALRLQVVACAAHLSAQHGMTVKHIIDDGFEVNARVEMLDEADDSHVAMVKAVAKGMLGFADAYTHLTPDCVLLLGDRYEMLAAAQTALLMNIPIAHIHGGERTEGAVDESIRHALTKMATLHFTAAEAYRQRVIQMGECPNRVFNCGAPGVDLIHKTNKLSVQALEEDLNLSFHRPLFVVTYHPLTLGADKGIQALKNLFTALAHFAQATVVWTGANADEKGQTINQLIQDWCRQSQVKAQFVTNLGSQRYISLMACADVVVGNSSSGIIEAPALGVPTVNIGERQKGRLRAASIIDCFESEPAIIEALTKALSAEFKTIAQQKNTLYGTGNSAQCITQQCAEFNFSQHRIKPFYDLPKA